MSSWIVSPYTSAAPGAAHAAAASPPNDCFYVVAQGELKWAAAVVQLKMKEREEQRAIKEQIREKAWREYERALNEAQKDQERIKN